MSIETFGTISMLSSVINCSTSNQNEEPKATFFVSKEGNDVWSGKLAAPNAEKTDGPFATVVRARDAIREMKARQSLSEPVTVMVRGGTYYLDDTIVFGQEDSGAKNCPITYMAYPGEEPVISGGREITAPWKTCKGDIMVCSIEEVKENKWNFRQLFVNGKRQKRARLPHEGYYYIEEALGDVEFRFKDGHFQNWRNLNDVEVVVFHSWNESRLLISELNETARTVKFIDPKARHTIGWSGAGGPNRYYIENVFEGLQNPGDWYLDRHTGELYYWPIDEIEKSVVVAPVLNQLVRFEGGIKEQHVQYINLCGFTFSDTDWNLPEKGYPDCGDVGDIVEPSAITLENVRYCTLKDNCIRNVGTYALELTGYGNQITGNEIYSTGGGGIISRNYDEERNVISYNHIHHCGEVYPSAVGINIDDGGGVISHNLIHDISHSGVYTRHWATEHQTIERENQEQGLIIEYNEIYDVMQKINDGGGLFVRDSNIIIRNNVIHDVFSYSDRCPGWGIYLGCETRDTIVENNIVYRAREIVHVWYYDRNVVMENNIFIDGELSQINYQNPSHLSHENIKLLRNIICYSKPDALLFKLSGERSLPLESDYNVFFHTAGKDIVNSGAPGLDSFEEWQKRGLDTNSIVADPLFVDVANDDYSLKPDSPALKLGFKPIDISEVGLRGRENK
ncbi:TPA: right-handed parallel beta-helix repeat-containing protein [Candidatus Poribacteria bacterium]|nr:right-handed parallel beta-helix repeat-containing protein [Candidatus Poribacteria bacterium]